MNLSDSISQLIKKKAEEKYPFHHGKTNLISYHNSNQEERRDHYTSGYQDAIEFIPDLLKWWDTNAVRNGEDEWTVGAGKETKRFTTEQLLSKFMEGNQLNS